MTDEEKQDEFNRKADAVAPEAVGCCLTNLLIGALPVLLVALVPAWFLFG